MGRPVNGYRLRDGTRVPGVTTIIGRYKESGGLIHWAWTCGRDGIDYRERSESAATAGTLAHEYIDAFIHNREPLLTTDDESLLLPAQRGFEAFKRWAEQSKLEILETETPLVHEELRFGGTLDAIGRVNGELALLDWKSGNRIYPDHIVQVSAYRELWEDHYPDQIVSWAHLLRVDKEFGSFAHFAWPREVTNIGWQSFRLMRRLYDLDAPLRRAAGV